jgi:hypothetical protein
VKYKADRDAVPAFFPQFIAGAPATPDYKIHPIMSADIAEFCVLFSAKAGDTVAAKKVSSPTFRS